jgi:structural maintenance of chromosome 3 (chondroitin sulfate proteoglycan 6)
MELQKQKAEKYLSKKSLISKKKEEAIRNIRDLGALPEEAFEKYQLMSMKQVL